MKLSMQEYWNEESWYDKKPQNNIEHVNVLIVFTFKSNYADHFRCHSIDKLGSN